MGQLAGHADLTIGGQLEVRVARTDSVGSMTWRKPSLGKARDLAGVRR
jgi:hypothetical protein